MLGLLLALIVVILVAAWLAPMIPAPGGQIVSVLCWIVAIVLAIYLIIGLLSGATSGVGLHVGD